MNYSYSITEKQYNYLLPIFGKSGVVKNRLLSHGRGFYFIGSHEDYEDMLNRCAYLD